ncbi:aminotransferase class V-fold PLP-dependent enzyme [Kineococcus gynurae]|uniref:Aminotransferase class V-fold PLP-dependent enzyme n=1 Tax=Kineococcus gynurae TaxID=452979 RepID=A0ABV5LQ52_9ACTN
MNAGAALMPAVVDQAVRAHWDLELRLGGYAAAAHAAEQLDGVYGGIARLLGADPDEIALTENATVAWQLAFYSLPLRRGDRVLTGEAEYAANYVAYLQLRRRSGIEIDVVPSDAAGRLDVAALEAMIDDRVKLISVTWVPTNGGLVNPAAQIGRVAARHGVLYLLDACQAVGQMPVDVRELGCDILTGTGRKFLRGPRGTGLLYMRRDLLQRTEPAMIDHFSAPWTSLDDYTLRPDARRFETWENAYALRAGLGAAVGYALDLGLERIQASAWGAADRVRRGLRGIDGVQVLDLGERPCALVSFRLDDRPADEVVRAAERAGVVIGVSAPGSTLLDARRRALPVINRASPHYYTSQEDIDRLLDVVETLART